MILPKYLYFKYFQIANINLTKALQLLQEIYDCKIGKSLLKSKWQYRWNFRAQFFCKNNLTKCSDPKFHQKICLESKQRLVKIVRLRLNQVAHLVPILRLKIIVVHRDPRAVMNSRWRPNVHDWCSK